MIVRLTQWNPGLGAGGSPQPGLCSPFLCLTSGASWGGQTTSSTGQRALALHHLAVCPKMWKRHWPPGSTKCKLN